MPSSWLSWRRSLACKTQLDDVHDPDSLHHTPDHSTARVQEEAAVFVSSRRLYVRSGCSRSLANLRDVIHSSRRIDGAHVPAMPNVSPKSVESNDFVQSISHEAMLQQHGSCDTCTPFKQAQHNQHHLQPSLHGKLSLDDIVASHHPHRSCNGPSGNANTSSRSFYGTPLHLSAHPSTNGRLAPPALPSSKGGNSLMKLSGCYDCKNPAVSLVVYKTSSAAAGSADVDGGQRRVDSAGSLPPVAPKAVCKRCGEAFPKYEALEEHHLLKHAVAELEVGDSSRNVVEIIFRTSWLRPPEPAPAGAPPSTSACGKLKIERVLKVNNLARTVAYFEDYREGVKIRASKLPKKHPRCLADGNELLRFYGARLECELVQKKCESAAACAAACSSPSCSVCKIIRFGFRRSRGPDGAANKGILTTATSGRAHQIMVDTAAAGGGNREGTSTHIHDQSREEDGGRTSAISGKDEHHIRRQSHPDGRTGGLMAMLVCRVIAGRVHKPPNAATTAPPTPPHSGGDGGLPGAGFDSVAGGDTWASGLPPPGMGLHSRFEELTVFNSRAILPCFVVLYRC